MTRILPLSRRARRHMRIAASLNVLVALACGAGPAWADTNGKASSHYVDDAKAYLAKGQLRAAEIQLKNALRDNPSDLEARIDLGVVTMREGDAAGAERSFKQALQLHASRDQVLPLLGQSYLMQGKATEILDEMRADGFAPAIGAQIADLRARAYIIQKLPDDAKKEAETALSLQPDMPDALLTMATLKRQQGDFVGAEALADRALKAAPTSVMALDVKGELRAAQGDPTGALAMFKKALAARPDDVNALLGEAASFLALDQIEPARHDVDQILARVPNQPAAHYLDALILQRSGKYSEALAALEPAAASLVDILPAQLLLGQLNLRANHVDKAQSYAEHALSLAPASDSAKLLLALVYARQDQPLKVVQLLEPVWAAAPDDAQIAMILGDAYGRLGRFNAAAKALAVASEKNPTDSDLRIRLDAGRIGAGDQETGMKDLTSLLQTDPQAKRAGVLLITATMNRGQLSEAGAMAAELRLTQPTNPLIDNLLGRIHWMKGEWKLAETDFQSALQKQPNFLDAIDNLVLIRQVQGEPDSAEALYGAVLTSDPKNIPAIVTLAGMAQAKGDSAAAVSWLEKASAVAPEMLALRIQMVELLLAQKQDQKALAAAQALAQTGPDNPEIVNLLARVQSAIGQQDNAVISLRHLAELQPNAALGQYRLGQTFSAINRPLDAVAAYRKAVESDPTFLPAWQALVATEASTVSLDRSMQTIAQAMLQAPVAPYGDVLKGEAFLAVKRYDDAGTAFQLAQAHIPDARWMLRAATVRSQAGDRAGAIAILAGWLKAHPDDGNVRGTYADALMANKDSESAAREYEILLSANPVNIAALNNLAWLYGATEPTKALADAHFAFGLAPQSPQVRDTLAWTLLQQGNVGTATILLRMAHAQQPGDPEVGYHLATALDRAGDTKGARVLVTPLAQSTVAFESQSDAKQLLHKLEATE